MTENLHPYYKIAKEKAKSKHNFSLSEEINFFSAKSGVSKKNVQNYVQFTSLQHIKNLLEPKQLTLFNDVSEKKLFTHNSFISIEEMTTAEFENQDKNLEIHFHFSETLFGKIMIASTKKGICFLAFSDDEKESLKTLKNNFPFATFINQENEWHTKAETFINNSLQSDINISSTIKLHLKGTSFQQKVWKTLLEIPLGNLSTYGNIANVLNVPKAARAVGSAVGKNPVAYLIPCHRVVQQSGKIGGYMWGEVRKIALIGCEQTSINK